MFNRTVAAIKKLLFSKKGSSPVVSFVILAPLILVVAFGISWFGHMADAQNVVEEAARAGARWLAAHPGDIDGAKARAAEVVQTAIGVVEGGGSYIPGGEIENLDLTGGLVGKLSKIHGKYYVNDRRQGNVRVKPASASVKRDLETLVGKEVVVDGEWEHARVFSVKEATTDPPETQTVSESGGSASSGIRREQTVVQTHNPGPFPAVELAKYGEGPWGTWWVPPAEDTQCGETYTYERKEIDFTEYPSTEGGSYAYWNPEFNLPDGCVLEIKTVEFKTAPAKDDYYTTQRVEAYKDGKWYVIKDYQKIHGNYRGSIADTINLEGKGYTKIRFNFVMYDKAHSAYGSPGDSYIRVVYEGFGEIYRREGIDFTAEGGRTAYWNPSFSAPDGTVIDGVSFKTAPAYDDYYTTQRVEGYKDGKWHVIKDYRSIRGNYKGFVSDTIDLKGKGYTKIRFNFVMYDKARSAYGSPGDSYVEIIYSKPQESTIADGRPDPEARWIWAQKGALTCALNGQTVQLSQTFWAYDYATYRLCIAADDHASVSINGSTVLQIDSKGMGTWNYWPKFSPYTKTPAYPQSNLVQVAVRAWNDYGPAGALVAVQHTGWHWDTSYPGYHAYNNGWRYYYPWVKVNENQWVTVTAKNKWGNPISVRVWDGKRVVASGTGDVYFYAYADPQAYLIYVYSSSDYNDVQVTFSKPNIVLRSDRTWKYEPVDGVRYDSVSLPTTVAPEAKFSVKIRATNTGRKEWFASAPSWWPSSYGSGKVKFSYRWLDEAGRAVSEGVSVPISRTVQPGSSVSVPLTVTAPSQPGRYKLEIDGIQEGATWFGPRDGVNWPTLEAWIDVCNIDYGVSYVPVQVPRYMESGKTYTLQVKAENTGSLTWTPQDRFGLSYHWYDKNSGKVVVWDGARDYVDYSVATGQTYTFDLPVTAPSEPGTYILEIDMVREGVTWFKDKGCPVLRAEVKVPAGEVLKGVVTYDGEDYWVGETMLRPLGRVDLFPLVGRNAILWGSLSKTSESFFRASSVQEHFPSDWTAVVTFDPEKDVLCNDPKAGDPEAPAGDPVGQPRADGYAYCRVTYHYPVPLRGFWRMVSHAGVPLWRGEEPPSRSLIGEAFFVSGEAGDQS